MTTGDKRIERSSSGFSGFSFDARKACLRANAAGQGNIRFRMA